jgi:hypothetical protein
VKDLIEAMNVFLDSAVAKAAEKKDDGNVHPPIAAITFKLGFYYLYPTIVAMFLVSDGSMVVKVNGYFPEQSV